MLLYIALPSYKRLFFRRWLAILASSERANRHLEDLAPPAHLESLLPVRLRRPLDVFLSHALPQHHHLEDDRHRQRMPDR